MLLINSAYTLMTFSATLSDLNVTINLSDLSDNSIALTVLAELNI